MSEFKLINVHTEDRIGLVTLSHPPANTLSQKMIQELETAFDRFSEDANVKVILLHGEGRFFAAGADIKEFTSVKHGDQFREMSREGQRVFRKIELMTKPVIAAIHGAALGGGLELAMACHIRLAAPDAKLGLPELQLGLVPGFAGTQRLPELVGKAKATEMLLTSDPITGEEAMAAGLVNRTLPGENFMDQAKKFAENISNKGSHSVSYVLELIEKSGNEPIERGQEIEAVRFGDVSETYDASEGIKAFMEKRKPKFEDR
ncbi:enoyl-CoA hydratase [Salipaludibacillus sp. CUR1]|uniref:enoyl-CoA hydratase n=1 Tax=Salipaludibacillus sp. CUR1 TaxID=2820003 RepID=UPI001E6513B3|nr:enoyl-CoA hydratase [Salipaludibacillus sp. CUR1]MCE7793420.1 enoyl-CoA hydratase [Salipaludibacillus sp. CUR1]